MNTLTLYELTSMVAEIVSDGLPGTYWVEAELSSIRDAGHCYMELVQKDIMGVTPVAKVKANCWRNNWLKIAPKFVSATGDIPKPGMQLLMKVSVTFSPTYGFSLTVNDIDPTFTLGDMARKRQEIIQRLKDEGVFDLQRELHLPLFCQRIAVISSEGAAGYGDFCSQLANNDYGFHFEVTLFPAIMQGEQVGQSVCAALGEIYESLDTTDYSCVVIIRGGGAVSDLSGFDSLGLAENVANFPIPIITGIGHDRDESVLDMISFQRVKTPTAAAAFLIDRLLEVYERVRDAETVIVNAARNRIERQRPCLDALVQRIISYCLLIKEKRLNRIVQIDSRLTNLVTQRLLRENHRLETIEQRLKALDPKLLLKRGYSMTVHNGKIVKNVAELNPGDEIETMLADGKVKSIVK